EQSWRWVDSNAEEGCFELLQGMQPRDEVGHHRRQGISASLAAESGDQTGADDAGLPGAGGSDHGEEPRQVGCLAQTRVQALGKSIAAEEVGGVGLLERAQ